MTTQAAAMIGRASEPMWKHAAFDITGHGFQIVDDILDFPESRKRLASRSLGSFTGL